MAHLLQDALDNVCPVIIEKMKRVSEASDGTTVSDQKRAVADEIMNTLEGVGLAYTANFQVEAVAPHPDNRSGSGVDPEDAQALVFAKIASVYHFVLLQRASTREAHPHMHTLYKRASTHPALL